MSGDVLTVYGKLDRLEELNHRRIGVAGLYAHQAAVDEHEVSSERKTESAEQKPKDCSKAELVTIVGK